MKRPVISNSSTLTTLRFAVRLVVVAGFVALWPDPTTLRAGTAALCVALATACFVSAAFFKEPLLGPELNHWHEAAALFGVGLLAYFASGRGT